MYHNIKVTAKNEDIKAKIDVITPAFMAQQNELKHIKSYGDATAADIAAGKTAMVQGLEVVGTKNLALDMINNCKDHTYLFFNRGDIVDLLEGIEEPIQVGSFKVDSCNNVFASCKPTKKKKIKVGLSCKQNINAVSCKKYSFQRIFDFSGFEEIDVILNRYDEMFYGFMCNNMFYDCHNLKRVDIRDNNGEIVNTSNTSNMFYNCYELETIDHEIYIQFDSVNGSALNMFYGCKKLKNVRFKYIRGTHLTIGSGTTWGHLLTIESLLSACKAMYNGLTLTVGSANIEKLSNVYVDSECNQVESTTEGAMLVTDYMALKSCNLA